MSNVINLLKELVSIDSVNPGLIEGGAGEDQMARFIAAWFERHGFAVQRFEDTPGRPSIVATAKGSGGGQTLMFNGHMDTVGVSDYNGPPHLPSSDDGKLYGRGSADMKSGLAAMMIAAERAASAGLRGDIVVACVADEEHTSIGTREILRHGVTADAAIVAEPMGFQLVVAHKGFIWLEVNVHGRSAHGSRPDLGIDAIAKAGKFLVELENYGEELALRPPHAMVGAASVHASLIKGGQEVTSYPAECTISIERRTVPGETRESVENELGSILARIHSTDSDFVADLVVGHMGDPFEIAHDAAIVTTLSEVSGSVTGETPALGSMTGWTDCALLAEAGIPSVVFGPSGYGPHSATEYVEVSSVERLVNILTETARRFAN